MMVLMGRILAASGVYKKRIQIAFVFSFLKSLLAKAPIGLAFWVLSAFYYKTMTAKKCVWCAAFMAVCLILQILCQNLSDRLQSAAGFMMFADKRMEFGEHLRRLPMGYFTEGNIGKISSVLSTDMVFIEENCMNVLADLMSDLFAQGIMLVFLWFLDWRLGLTAAVVLFFIVLVARAMKKEGMEDSAARQEQSENLTAAVLDFIEGIGIIKSCNLLGEKSRELTENFRKSCEVSLHFEEAHAPWQRRLGLLYGGGAVLILAVASFLQAQGELSVPYLIGVLLFVFDLYGPIKALYTQSARLTVMSSCMDRMEEVFGEPELPDDGNQKLPEAEMHGEGWIPEERRHPAQCPEIEFRDVSFSYDMAAEPGKVNREVLQHISFSVPQGSMTALVGPSGGGKSTIASLLTRFWDVKQGQILVRGTDIRQVPLSDLMDQISVVFQRVYLFQDTVYNNISMGRPEASREEVLEAAKKARCYDFVMKLPDGFDTVVGEGGATLSGGEKQRISIARCMLKNAPIVILDEATASVDEDNESYIQEAISELCRGKTLLVIAHRLNTIRNADQILVIGNGSIVQAGSHEELIKTEGIYRNFVTARQQEQGWNRKKERG